MQRTTILFMFLYALTLNSMEKEHEHIDQEKTFLEELQSLPTDLQKEVITTALLTSKNIDEAIAATEAAIIMGLCYKQLSDFNRLVHILANKFKISTKSVAEKIKTPIAETYLSINNDLLFLIKSENNNTQTIIELIHNGADINFSNAKDPSKFDLTGRETPGPLHLAISTNKIELVKLLLNLGANLYWADKRINKEKLMHFEYYQDNTSSSHPSYKELMQMIKIAEQIKQILEDAMPKK